MSFLQYLVNLYINKYSITGVSVNTGKVLYECNVMECKNNTASEGHDDLGYDVLIIHRFQQTVRAIEPHTGNER